jgi:branched-chain amino acid aminotransferase
VLTRCEEAFLTSSTRDVHPIAEIDGRALATPGPLTQAVQAAYAAHLGA